MKQILFITCISCSLFAQETPEVITKRFVLPVNLQPDKDYERNTVLIKFREINPTGIITIKSPEVKALKIKSIFIEKVRQLFPNKKSDDDFGLRRMIEIKYSSKEEIDIEQVINQILEYPNIETAEPQYIEHLNISLPSYPYIDRPNCTSPLPSYINYAPSDP